MFVVISNIEHRTLENVITLYCIGVCFQRVPMDIGLKRRPSSHEGFSVIFHVVCTGLEIRQVVSYHGHWVSSVHVHEAKRYVIGCFLFSYV